MAIPFARFDYYKVNKNGERVFQKSAYLDNIDGIRVGRGSRCTFKLDDEYASVYQCQISVNILGIFHGVANYCPFVVMTNASKNKTYINGIRVDQGIMMPGDVISTRAEGVGGAEFHYQLADPKDGDINPCFGMHPIHQAVADAIEDRFYVTDWALGKGGDATVYLGGDVKTGLAVAVKFSNIKETFDGPDDPNHRLNLIHVDNLIREIKLHRRLEHPNVLRYKGGYFVHGVVGCVVTELGLAGDLFSLMQSCRYMMPEARLRTISRDLLRAVIYLHQRGLMHLDIKPENIMMMGKNQRRSHALLSDYGHSHPTGTILTVFKGTGVYASPEMFRSSEATPMVHTGKADMWPLGMTLLNLVAGTFPLMDTFKQISWRDYAALLDDPQFDPKEKKDLKDRAQDKVIEILDSMFNDPNQYAFNLRDSAKRFIASCLQVDPNKRMSSLDAVNHPWIKDTEGHHVRPSRTARFKKGAFSLRQS